MYLLHHYRDDFSFTCKSIARHFDLQVNYGKKCLFTGSIVCAENKAWLFS